MAPFIDKILRAGGAIATALARFQERIKLRFPSKSENGKRAPKRFERLRRQEMEAERIDRLRNPSNYQGR